MAKSSKNRFSNVLAEMYPGERDSRVPLPEGVCRIRVAVDLGLSDMV